MPGSGQRSVTRCVVSLSSGCSTSTPISVFTCPVPIKEKIQSRRMQVRMYVLTRWWCRYRPDFISTSLTSCSVILTRWTHGRAPSTVGIIPSDWYESAFTRSGCMQRRQVVKGGNWAARVGRSTRTRVVHAGNVHEIGLMAQSHAESREYRHDNNGRDWNNHLS